MTTLPVEASIKHRYALDQFVYPFTLSLAGNAYQPSEAKKKQEEKEEES